MAPAPRVISDKASMRSWSRSMRAQGKLIGLVPTMGFLHAGHLSLVAQARQLSDVVAVSIYVNPGQFAPTEDLSTYPSDFDGDVKKLASVPGGVDVVFHPRNLYDYGKNGGGDVAEAGGMVSCVESGSGHESWVRVEKLELGLCGKSRPVFFRGVATVVTKLFNIVEPDVAVFGKKDYQQWRLIQRMSFYFLVPSVHLSNGRSKQYSLPLVSPCPQDLELKLFVPLTPNFLIVRLAAGASGNRQSTQCSKKSQALLPIHLLAKISGSVRLDDRAVDSEQDHMLDLAPKRPKIELSSYSAVVPNIESLDGQIPQVRDLDFSIKVIGAEITRDNDGLAMSSRNVHLSPEEREKALSINKSLLRAKSAAGDGQVHCEKLTNLVIQSVTDAGGRIDYAEIVDQNNLEKVEQINSPVVFCVAAWFGKVRLIDNMEINLSMNV
ncbi:Pantoate--beta-alanine ligase [Glycine soja]